MFFTRIRGPHPSLFLMKMLPKYTHTHTQTRTHTHTHSFCWKKQDLMHFLHNFSYFLPISPEFALVVWNNLFSSVRAGDRDLLPHPPHSCATACLCPLGQVLSPFHTAAVLPSGKDISYKWQLWILSKVWDLYDDSVCLSFQRVMHV